MNDYQVWFSFEYCSVTVHVDTDSTDEDRIIAEAAEIIAQDLGITEWNIVERSSDTRVDLMGEWA